MCRTPTSFAAVTTGPSKAGAFASSADEIVEDRELLARVEQPSLLVLAVEDEKLPGDPSQVTDRRAAACDQGFRPSVGADPAREHQLLGVLGQPLRELRAQLGVEREDTLDVSLDGAGAHYPLPRAGPEEQIDGVGENRLARTGLTGEHVQTGREPQLGALDDEQVLDPQFQQHCHGLTSARRRSAALMYERVCADTLT